MNNIITKPVVVTFLAVLLVLGIVWQFLPGLLVNPGWVKEHDKNLSESATFSEETQKKILTIGAQAGQQQMMLQLRDAAASGKDIQIQIVDPKDSKQYNFTLVNKPATSTLK